VNPLRLLSLVSIGIFASCASTQKSTSLNTPEYKSSVEQLKEISGGKHDPNSYSQSSNGDGKWMAGNNKRSPYESKGEDPNFTKNFAKSEYKTNDYAKKSWWGNKNYDTKSYTGNTDGSRFQKPSDLQDKGARESGTAANIATDYKTKDYATGNAGETAKKPISMSSNYGIERRRNSFKQPEIVDWKSQRNMSISESKSLLGH
jgi:hypothetical protein